jgi:hypothetical protein
MMWLFWSLLGVERTSTKGSEMSANDPTATSTGVFRNTPLSRYDAS